MSQKPKIKKSPFGGYSIEGIFGRYETFKDAEYRVSLIPIIEAQHAWNMEKWKAKIANGQPLLQRHDDEEDVYIYTSPF